MSLMWAARYNTWLLIKLRPKAWSVLLCSGWFSHVQCKEAVASALTQASNSHMPEPRKQHIPCTSVCDMSLAEVYGTPKCLTASVRGTFQARMYVTGASQKLHANPSLLPCESRFAHCKFHFMHHNFALCLASLHGQTVTWPDFV